jgi:hypothetical protein
MDSWQQQCCGDDFGVGSAVTWSAFPTDGPDEWIELLLGRAWADRVTYREEHHVDDDGASLVIAGTVHSIREVSCRRTLQPGKGLVPVAGSGILNEVGVADKWSAEPSDDLRGRMSFDGWIIELELGL